MENATRPVDGNTSVTDERAWQDGSAAALVDTRETVEALEAWAARRIIVEWIRQPRATARLAWRRHHSG